MLPRSSGTYCFIISLNTLPLIVIIIAPLVLLSSHGITLIKCTIVSGIIFSLMSRFSVLSKTSVRLFGEPSIFVIN